MFLHFIIFICVFIFFTIFLNPHASTLARSIFVFVESGPRQFIKQKCIPSKFWSILLLKTPVPNAFLLFPNFFWLQINFNAPSRAPWPLFLLDSGSFIFLQMQISFRTQITEAQTNLVWLHLDMITYMTPNPIINRDMPQGFKWPWILLEDYLTQYRSHKGDQKYKPFPVCLTIVFFNFGDNKKSCN